ncbi:MAG: hypothetical protein ACI83I_002298 [Bacteroidia bacterium]
MSIMKTKLTGTALLILAVFIQVLAATAFPKSSLDLYAEYNQNGNRLKEVFLKETPFATHIRYDHFYKDVPVRGSFLVIHIPNQPNHSSLITNRLCKIFDAHGSGDSSGTRYWLFRKGNPVLCEKQLIRNAVNGATEIRYLANGEIVAREDARRYHHPQPDTMVNIQVFMPNPIETSNSEYGTWLSDNNDQESSNFHTEYFSAKLGLKKAFGKFNLDDSLLFYSDVSAPNLSYFPTQNTSFIFNRSETGFELTNSYFHLKAYSNSLIKAGYRSLLDTLVIDPHAMNGEDQSAFNAHIEPHTIEFGTGGVDDAEDGQVVIHEFVHSLSQNAAPFTYTGSDRKAMEEGFADYLCMAYSRELTGLSSTNIFSWDGHNEFWDGFDLQSNKNYQFDRTGNPNTDREIWSGTLNNIAEIIGFDILKTLLYEQLFHQFDGATMPEMAENMLSLDRAYFDGIQELELRACFERSGILTKQKRAFPPQVEVILFYPQYVYSQKAFVQLKFDTVVHYQVEMYNIQGQQIKEEKGYGEQVIFINDVGAKGINMMYVYVRQDEQIHLLKTKKLIW